MAGVAKLVDPGTGALNADDYKESVATLLAAAKGDANPAITKQPDAGATTSEITDKIKAADVQP